MATEAAGMSGFDFSNADYVTGEVLAVNGGAFAGRMYLPLSSPKAP